MILHMECPRLQLFLLLVRGASVGLVMEGSWLVYFFLYGLLEFAVKDDVDLVARRSLRINNLIFDEAHLLPVIEQFVKGGP